MDGVAGSVVVRSTWIVRACEDFGRRLNEPNIVGRYLQTPRTH
jgi:hypothetical protein